MQRQNSKRSLKPVGLFKRPRPDESRTFKQAIQELENTIREKLDEKPIASGNLVAILFVENSELIEELTPHWQQRELLRIVRSVLRAISREEGENDQYMLPGFEAIPARFVVKNQRHRLSAAIAPTLREYLATLEAQRQQDTPRMVQLRKLIELMEKYEHREPEITVREVCQREAR